jgi:hypothetical protein
VKVPVPVPPAGKTAFTSRFPETKHANRIPATEQARRGPFFISATDSPQTANARQRASYAPERDVQLTGKGIAYCERFGRPAIERRIERHLALVTALLAIIDQQDGDPDVEIDEDLEEDHDDAEPDDEDGCGWSEASSLTGMLDGGKIDDDEHSLGMPESMNQVTRATESPHRHAADGEADHFIELPFGRTRTFQADEEDQFFGSRVIRGKIIADREASECGRYEFGGAYGYDDNGVGDDGGLQDAFGRAV